jgi:hypothetical protein
MTKGDRIRQLLAKGLEPDVIAERLGCSTNEVRCARYDASEKGAAARVAYNKKRREQRRGAA